MIATKEQEIKALDQIRKIVEGLGPDRAAPEGRTPVTTTSPRATGGTR